jgi:tetratricopeptide (TPR) repeat protein
MFQIQHLLAVFALTVAGLITSPAWAQSASNLSRSDAINGLSSKEPLQRLNGLAAMAEIGLATDADKVVPLLSDAEPELRQMAAVTIWQVWSRTGDKMIDAQFQEGVKLMQAAKLDAAVSVFSTLIKKRPDFAEAWNKRATILFMQGQLEQSLQDCDEVMKRNPNHFGALSGKGQILIRQGKFKQAIEQLERAQKINPSLEGTEEMIEQIKALEQRRVKQAA